MIRESVDYSQAQETAGLGQMVKDMRDYLNGDQGANSSFDFPATGFSATLKKDSLWIPLIVELGQKMNKTFILKNQFSSGLQAVVINDNTYKKYFGSTKHIEKNWTRFRDHYPGYTFLIEFSDIASDGKRAVFYFSSRCGGLCGRGCLVLFYKQRLEWKFLQILRIWDS